MLTEDCDLKHSDIQRLSNPDEVASFFLNLGYNIDARLLQIPAALGIDAGDLARRITRIEQIAVQDDWLHVYLFEMKTLRVADRQALARTFRNRKGDFLLVLTSDYETLDFVLLERLQRENDGTAFAQRQVPVRPRVLTVTRSDPSAVALRVLRRFSYTEQDAFYQFDKLLSAYTVAEWSEPLFNNRALFSDYYLNNRLRDTPEWQEDPRPVYRALQELFANVRSRLGQADEATTRTALIEPTLEALGFSGWEDEREGDGTTPDYTLYPPDADANETPPVYCMAYQWNRYLDGRDEQRGGERKDENPGARVITLLGSGEARYAIVTNGKLWRLYAAQTHSRATNYYEIDLEETLNSPDRGEAIRYFWLFFRAAAFRRVETIREGEARPLSFIAQVWEDSDSYAKELGERLKERVFEEVFPHFAEGFIDTIRQVEGRDIPIDQARLDLIYQGTLTFLYRLMFLLYAEARDLLPIKETRGYWEISLQRLKEDIALEAGDILDEAPEELRKAYRADSTKLYDHLTALFTVIDRGDLDRNVPRYNGGLFITDPPDEAETDEAITARFLRDAKIPDRYLVLGLDRLARDLDPKTHALAMIDFKSLGVRHLGSIYEGLLEFRLRIASGKMAIVQGKRTEEVIPYREAAKQKRRILTEGRGQNRRERILESGTVYLENTRQERKATGSYYTPDYIVKYIVEHTVGPVLEEKFEALRPRLREAERLYGEHARRVAQTGDAPEKFWNREDMLRLAYDVLDVKVLDPAMGSGHFLVEAVDFITDRMLDFLNGFPHNPVRASLRRTREAILAAMEEQRVSIDPGRLTDVALLKRQVLKRCVYGVDLNPMAVELAKVSLWLDAFTLGAPLSFLDHHLRYGNSLIGATAREADAELASMGKAPGQMTFMTGPFVGLLQSAEFMLGIGALADATIEQAQESARLFHSFEEAAKPYKQLLDVYVMRYFGVKRADEFLRLYGAEAMKASPEKLGSPYKEVLEQRAEMYRQYHFFHWDLEFPEVFIDLREKDWAENAGFDAVVGNPPYSTELESNLRRYVELVYSTGRGYKNLALHFLEVSITQCRHRCGLIVPKSITYSEGWSAGFELVWAGLTNAIDASRAWSEVLLEMVVLIVDVKTSSASYDAGQFSNETIQTTLFEKEKWRHLKAIITSATDQERLISETIWQKSLKMGAITENDRGVVGLQGYCTSDGDIAIIRGDSITRYGIHTVTFIRKEILTQHNPDAVLRYSHRKLAAQNVVAHVEQPKDHIILMGTITEGQQVPLDTVNNLVLTNPDWSLDFLLGLFNSHLLSWYMYRFVYNRAIRTMHLDGAYTGKLPVPTINFTNSADQRTMLTAALIAQYDASDFAGLLAATQDHLDTGVTDVIHDLLAHLARQMIDLNKQKQAEVKRFLGWLERQIGAHIGDVTGKSIIQGYLGDYQKGEAEHPFEDILDKLLNNRRIIKANLSDTALVNRLRQEYEASLGVLLPIKQRLAETDWLIDQVVYKLYGLTEEEIAIVEGRNM